MNYASGIRSRSKHLQEKVPTGVVEWLIRKALQRNEPVCGWDQLGQMGFRVNENGGVGLTSICSVGAAMAEAARIAQIEGKS